MKKIIIILILITAVVFGGRYVFNKNLVSNNNTGHLAQISGYELDSSVPQTATLGQTFSFNVLTKSPVNGYVVSLTDLSDREVAVLKTFETSNLQTGFKGISVTIPTNILPGVYKIKFTGKIGSNTAPNTAIGSSKINIINDRLQPVAVSPSTRTDITKDTVLDFDKINTSSYNLDITPVPGKPFVYRFTWSGLPTRPITIGGRTVFVYGKPKLDNINILSYPDGRVTIDGGILMPRPTSYVGERNDVSAFSPSGSFDFYVTGAYNKKTKADFEFFIADSVNLKKKIKTVSFELPAVKDTQYRGYEDKFSLVSDTVKVGEKLYIRMPKAQDMPWPYMTYIDPNVFQQIHVKIIKNYRTYATFDKSSIDFSRFSSEGLIGVTIPPDMKPGKDYFIDVLAVPYRFSGNYYSGPFLKITK